MNELRIFKSQSDLAKLEIKRKGECFIGGKLRNGLLVLVNLAE